MLTYKANVDHVHHLDSTWLDPQVTTEVKRTSVSGLAWLIQQTIKLATVRLTSCLCSHITYSEFHFTLFAWIWLLVYFPQTLTLTRNSGSFCFIPASFIFTISSVHSWSEVQSQFYSQKFKVKLTWWTETLMSLNLRASEEDHVRESRSWFCLFSSTPVDPEV